MLINYTVVELTKKQTITLSGANSTQLYKYYIVQISCVTDIVPYELGLVDAPPGATPSAALGRDPDVPATPSAALGRDPDAPATARSSPALGRPASVLARGATSSPALGRPASVLARGATSSPALGRPASVLARGATSSPALGRAPGSVSPVPPTDEADVVATPSATSAAAITPAATGRERVNARARRRRAISPDLATEESELFCAWLRSDTEKNGKKMRIMALQEEELTFRIMKIKRDLQLQDRDSVEPENVTD